MNVLAGVLLEVVFLIIFALLGMALIPDTMDSNQSECRKVSIFLISPLVGFATWLAITCCFGMYLPYNAPSLWALLVVVGAFIYYRRKKLYLPKNVGMWGFVFGALIISAIIIYAILPLTTKDGIYFSMSASDNTRVCLIDSIVRNGLPPINPHLTYNGELLKTYYHFGIMAFAAQPVIMCGIDSMIALSVTNGLAIIFLMFLVGAICYRYIYKTEVWVFITIFFLISAPRMALEKILPVALQDILYPHESFIGFFPLVGELTFSPHSCIASAIMILMMYLYAECIDSEDKKSKYQYAVVIGVIAAASFYISVYGGILSSAILGATAGILYILKKEFRVSINKSIIQHIVIVAVALLLSISYILYLFSRPAGGDSGLIIGFLPAYGNLSGLRIIGAFLDFYLFLLPSNVGLFMLFALAAILIPKLLPDNKFMKVARIFICIVLLSIFVVRSSAMTNDYGWRMTEIPYIIGLITAVFVICKLFGYLYGKKKAYGYLVILCCVFITFAIGQEIVATLAHTAVPGDSNRVFMESVKGWDVVREYTDKNDIVMSNPDAFADISLRNESNDYQGINYFSSYYADRYLVINDLLTPKTSYAGPQSFDEIDELYNRMVKIFAGDVSSDDVEFLATEQKVKALLVLAQDGLYSNEGMLNQRYELVDENGYYKVYVLK